MHIFKRKHNNLLSDAPVSRKKDCSCWIKAISCLACAALSCLAIQPPAFAENTTSQQNIPQEVIIPKPGQASVSPELSITQNSSPKSQENNTIGTHFYMYIPPDPEILGPDIPKMGDERSPACNLFLTSITSGTIFIITSGVFDDKRQKN